jgi:starch synthase
VVRKTDGPALGKPLKSMEARLVRGRFPNREIDVWLVDAAELYRRAGGLYVDERGEDWPDNHLRFGLLSRVAATLAGPESPLSWHPDVLHAHDWQAGLAAAYSTFDRRSARSTGRGSRPNGRSPVHTVFTVHNIAYQGLFSPSVMEDLDLPADSFSVEGVEFYDRVSFLKAGLFYADRITTVSPTHAREIQTPEGGFGLDGLLSSRRRSLSGILNGADYRTWSPTHDPALARPYRPTTLRYKEENKDALQQELGLSRSRTAPLLGVVGRLNKDKGSDLIISCLAAFREMGCQLALLGSGEKALEERLVEEAALHPETVSVKIGYDEKTAHRIMAGSDLFLMPSRVEPCGLTQMYAMRYGTPPVVRRTGGLADTVTDVSRGEEGTGFVFDDPYPEELVRAVGRAIDARRDRRRWRAIQWAAMTRDFCWARAARSYLDIYESAGRKERTA